jgi:hypothetical protein
MSTAVAALALAPPAAAGGARTVDARYTVSWLGFPVYSAHMLGRIDGGQYSLRFSAWGEGVVRVSGGTTIAWETNGRVTPDGFVPATFLQSNTWRKQTRRITTSFNGKGVPAVSVEPPESPGKRPLVPDALKLGTVDPLTAVLASLAQPASRRDCRFEARVFEGLRRTDIRFELAGIERTPPTGVAGLSLESGLCLMHARRVAGYEDRSFKNAPDPLPPAKIWVAYHAASASWIPVQLRFESRYGPIYARLTRLDAARAAP